MKRILLLSGLTLLLLLPGCKKEQILVSKIVLTPENTKLFVGETQEYKAECYPSTAGNLDQLTISIADTEVANFENGKLLAKSPGNTEVQARCGDVSAVSYVLVYSGWFTKRGQRFGVDVAEGYNLLRGEETVQAIELNLINQINSEEQEHFWLWLPCSEFGKTIDFHGVVGETMVAVYRNNNEDGYTLFGSEEPGCELRSADWVTDVSNVSLVKGTLKVDSPSTGRFRVEADFELSDGFTFTADWEGMPIMTTM